MKRTRFEIKAKLLEDVEAELDDALDWQETAGHPNLTAFENKVLEIRKSIGIRELKEILQDKDSERGGEVLCPTCGTR